MNRIATLLLVFSIVSVNAQEPDSTSVKVGRKNIVTVTESDDQTNVKVFDDDFVVVDEKDDTVKIKLGNKGISIIETDKGTNVEIIEMEDFDKHGWKKRKSKFRGHWAGYELGLNNFLDNEFELAGTTPETDFLDLNTGKSWNVNLNFMQYSLPMARNIGWVTGMGFEWNNYHFDRNNSIGKDPVSGVIIPVYPPNGATYDKTKLNTTYLTIPLLLEFQFGKNRKGFISAGAIGGLKIHSNTKVVYRDAGGRQKNKIKNVEP